MIAGIFALISLLSLQDWPLGQDHPLFFRTAAFVYLAASAFFILNIRTRWPGFRAQLSLHIFTDIVLITALTTSSGGIASGLGLLLLVPLASAGLVGQGKLALLYASVASIAMLGMHSLRVLQWQSLPQDYLPTALLCMSYFAVASLAHILTRRVLLSELVAQEKARELALVNRIHALATSDSTDGILAVDQNSRVIYCNPQAAKLLENSAIWPGTDLAGLAPKLIESVRHWKNQTGAASALVSGGLVRARFLSLENDDTLVLLEDPTRAEALAQQIKLAALGRLTLNVAHEIRNPLSAIGHAAQLLSEDASPASPVGGLTKIIENNVHRLDRMVQDMLTLNRRDRQPQETMVLSDFVRIWLSEWREAEEIPENAVIVSMDNPATTVSFSPQHLHQILWNLAGNAWRYCSKQAGSIRLSVQHEAGMATLLICDDGCGIPADEQSQLFEPFYTTHAKGTGLGLYIARELADANQSSLNFSGNHPGACFKLVMPDQTRPIQTSTH